jgi:hypothetical protein
LFTFILERNISSSGTNTFIKPRKINSVIANNRASVCVLVIRERAESKNYHTRRIPVGESPARRSLSDSEHQLRASDEKIATGILAQHVVVVLIVLWGDRKRSRSHANPLSPDSPLDHSMHANRVSRRNMSQLKSAKQERDHELTRGHFGWAANFKLDAPFTW